MNPPLYLYGLSRHMSMPIPIWAKGTEPFRGLSCLPPWISRPRHGFIPENLPFPARDGGAKSGFGYLTGRRGAAYNAAQTRVLSAVAWSGGMAMDEPDTPGPVEGL